MKKTLSMLALIGLLASCEKYPDMSKLDNDFIVLTNYDKAVDFGAFTSYYLPDSVLVIGKDKKASTLAVGDNEAIIQAFQKNMDNRGYTRTTDKEDADVGLQISYIEDVSYFHDYDNSYWWWGYPGYWEPGYWGHWGGWYYPYPVYYSYTIGSLLTEMVILKAPDTQATEENLPIGWTAYMTGLLYNSNKLNTKLAVRSVDQAFEQSLYLQKQ